MKPYFYPMLICKHSPSDWLTDVTVGRTRGPPARMMTVTMSSQLSLSLSFLYFFGEDVENDLTIEKYMETIPTQ